MLCIAACLLPTMCLSPSGSTSMADSLQPSELRWCRVQILGMQICTRLAALQHYATYCIVHQECTTLLQHAVVAAWPRRKEPHLVLIAARQRLDGSVRCRVPPQHVEQRHACCLQAQHLTRWVSTKDEPHCGRRLHSKQQQCTTCTVRELSCGCTSGRTLRYTAHVSVEHVAH